LGVHLHQSLTQVRQYPLLADVDLEDRVAEFPVAERVDRPFALLAAKVVPILVGTCVQIDASLTVPVAWREVSISRLGAENVLAARRSD
jgi:hypothetical protein